MKEKSILVTISKGQQITIPSEYRDYLNLKIGSKVELIKNFLAKI